MNDIPEIEFKITTVKVESKTRPLRRMTVRNMFYKGFTGKASTMWAWVRYHSDKSFSDYLNSPVTWTIELPTDIYAYHDLKAQEDLTKELTNELKNDTTKKN